MKEEFVSYEIAKRLKECGFDWECDHYYELQKEFREARVFPATFRMSDFWHNFNEDDQPNRHNQPFYPEYSAPSLSFAQKWLREVKGIDVEVVALLEPIRMKKNYKANLCYFDKDDKGEKYANYKVAALNIPTYELALSSGIDAALKLLKDKS